MFSYSFLGYALTIVTCVGETPYMFYMELKFYTYRCELSSLRKIHETELICIYLVPKEIDHLE